jgi:urea transport system permease protein
MLLAAGISAVGALGAGAGAARADALDSALQRFAADSFPETGKAIEEIAASGSPEAAAILQALGDRRLFWSGADKSVYYRDSAGNIFEAKSGRPTAAPPADLSAVRTNNRLRSAIEMALSATALLSSEPDKRLEAAQAVFKARDAAKLGAVEAALAKEQDAKVKTALAEARAAILVSKADAPEAVRITAIALLRARSDQDTLAVLKALAPETPAAVRASAAQAIGAIEGRLALWNGAQNVWYGLSLGSVLLLAAIGLAITFGVMGVINMAHGEMVMLGAYTTFVVQEVIRSSHPALFDHSLAIAVPLAFAVAGAVGVAIERGVIRFLYGRPLETLLATWGISLVLQQAVRTMFGPTNREVGAPSFMSGTFKIGELAITWNRLWIIVFAAAIFAALLFTLRYTTFGLQMRAVTQNRRMAGAMGIRTPRVDALTFGLGSGIAGLAGVALSQIDNVSPNLGQGYIIDSFLVVVFGGVGNLWGTLVGALSLGIANKLLEPYAGAVLGKIALLVLVILFIQKRPRGLFAVKGRAVEA